MTEECLIRAQALIRRFTELNPERVYTYEQIFERIWQDNYFDDKQRIANQVCGLRKKLKDVDCIESVHDMGYRFKKSKK